MVSRILIVDDDRDYADLLAKHLRAKRVSVETAGSARIAKRSIERFKPDLIFLDIMLPDQSGIGFIDVIRAKNPKLPIIMISGLGDLPIVLNAMKAGAADYMQKPIGYEELWNKITKILPQDTVSSAM